MIDKNHFCKTNSVGFVLGAVLLAALAKGVSSADGQAIGIAATSPEVVVAAPVVVAPAIVVQDEYVYYPAYGVYFNSSQNRYAYLSNGAWVFAPAPYGVSIDMLQASPSVNMDWHDSPERHHAEMLQRYPKNWKSSDERHDQEGDRKAVAPDDDKRTSGQTRPPNN